MFCEALLQVGQASPVVSIAITMALLRPHEVMKLGRCLRLGGVHVGRAHPHSPPWIPAFAGKSVRGVVLALWAVMRSGCGPSGPLGTGLRR